MLTAWYYTAMAAFVGGSAFTMVRDIAEGYVLLAEPQLKKFTVPELDQLRLEMEKSIRERRGSPPPQENTQEVQAHQRKLLRLTGALRMVMARIQKMRRNAS
jgi:hypothetical protein